jgi:hypothetical protein
MATPIKDLNNLHGYVVPAMKRAMCHAQNVAEIMPAILGNIMLYADPASLERRGDGSNTQGNMGWIESAATGRRYAVVYSHQRDAIEIRERTVQGRVLHTMTNATDNKTIIAAFASL